MDEEKKWIQYEFANDWIFLWMCHACDKTSERTHNKRKTNQRRKKNVRQPRRKRRLEMKTCENRFVRFPNNYAWLDCFMYVSFFSDISFLNLQSYNIRWLSLFVSCVQFAVVVHGFVCVCVCSVQYRTYAFVNIRQNSKLFTHKTEQKCAHSLLFLRILRVVIENSM